MIMIFLYSPDLMARLALSSVVIFLNVHCHLSVISNISSENTGLIGINLILNYEGVRE